MGWPREPALTKDSLDADSDSLTGGRAEIEELLDKVNLLLLEVEQGATLWSTSNDSTLAKLNATNTFLTSQICNENMHFNKTATFQMQGTSGTSIDWRLGNKFWCSAPSGTLSFTNPPGACNLTLLFSTPITLPAIVKWPNGGVIPVFQGATVVSLFFSGTSYFAVETTNFA